METAILGTETAPFNPDQAHDFVIEVTAAGMTPYLVGPPGVGKTESVKKAAKTLGLPCKVVLLAQREPVDFTGIPFLVEEKGYKRTRFAPPAEFDTDKPCLLFMDELAQADTSVQRAASEVFLEHSFGGIPLHKETVVVGASNRRQDRAGVVEILSHNKSRLVTAHVHCDVQSWLIWAIEAGIHEAVVGYISKSPNALAPANGHITAGYSYPCPRTWEFVSKALVSMELRNASKTMLGSIVAGAVGPQEAEQFVKYYRQIANFPRLDEIFKSPHKARVPSDPADRMQMAFSIFADYPGYHLDTDKSDSAFQYLERLGADALAGGLRKAGRELSANEGYMSHHSKITDRVSAIMKGIQTE